MKVLVAPNRAGAVDVAIGLMHSPRRHQDLGRDVYLLLVDGAGAAADPRGRGALAQLQEPEASGPRSAL